ncbi:MAG: hypothetical protein E7265_10905 [Lachnospiraceae bacterium]|nr:hypothetical protein [Lachnospiraceae bacterium]
MDVNTKIQKVECDWLDVKNECRNTVNKDATSVDATPEFKKKLLISEHSPIRLLGIKWRWEGIFSWVSVHFARHWLGWDKWVSTQRTDRTGVDRNKQPQDTKVNMDIRANAQALINVARFRLCFQASPETRGCMEDLKVTVSETEPQISEVMVPNCVYRCGCPEFKSCGYWEKFVSQVENKEDLLDVSKRYDLYNEYFNKHHK